MQKLILGVIIALCSSGLFAKSATLTIVEQIEKVFQSNFAKYKNSEYFSAASLSYYIPNQPIKNFYLGNVSHAQGSANINSNSLFEIGSISKSYTAALLLQLEKDKKLSLDDTLVKWLPRYAKWNNINLRSLLNMTSGLPNYSETPKMNVTVADDLAHVWTDAELIDFVYPRGEFNPPLKSGFFYSNTNYILSGLIAEKAAQQSFQEGIASLIKAADLQNTFYPVPIKPNDYDTRLISGYNYNQYDSPELVGKDVKANDLSWAGAAGAVISTSEDVIKWVKALFVEHKILDAAQKNKLMQLVDMNGGKPIKHTSAANPKAFALGVAQIFDKKQGAFWYYEGETLGFRAMYLYKPCSGVIVSGILNSATNNENDHLKDFLMDTYEILLKQNPKLRCS